MADLASTLEASKKATAVFACNVLLAAALIFGFSQAAFAESPCGCWIDVKTGKQVPSVPRAGVNQHMDSSADAGVAVVGGGGKTAFNTRTGQNYALESCAPPSRAAGGPTIELNLGFGDRRRTDDEEDTLFGGRDRPCSGIGIGGFGIGGCAEDD